MKLINWRLAITAIFLLAVSCKKPDSKIGLDLIEDQLASSFDESSFIESYSIRVDSLETDSLSSYMIGTYQDPVFGISKASLFSQINLSGINPPFGDLYQIDSTILTLKPSGYNYGLGVLSTFDVFEVDEEITDVDYYSTNSFSLKTTNFVEDPNFGYKISSLTKNLSIRLNDEFANKMKDGVDNFSNSDSFLEFFKGIKISSTNNWSSVVGYDLTGSEITIHYKTLNDDGDSITLAYDFLLGSNTNKFSHFEHESFLFFDNDTVVDDTYDYIQGGASLITKLYFPDLLDDYEEGVIFNKTELILPIVDTDISTYSLPAIDAYFLNDDGDKVFVNIASNFDSSDDVYRLNITPYIQNILKREIDDNGLYLVSNRGRTSVSRAIIKSDEIKLRVFHTE